MACRSLDRVRVLAAVKAADTLKGAPKYGNENSWNWDDPGRARVVNDYYSGF